MAGPGSPTSTIDAPPCGSPGRRGNLRGGGGAGLRRTSWPKREWVAQRPDLVADPVSAQMLGETDADEALDCDEGPDEDDV
jgi:hypothetical protein